MVKFGLAWICVLSLPVGSPIFTVPLPISKITCVQGQQTVAITQHNTIPQVELIAVGSIPNRDEYVSDIRSARPFEGEFLKRLVLKQFVHEIS